MLRWKGTLSDLLWLKITQYTETAPSSRGSGVYDLAEKTGISACSIQRFRDKRQGLNLSSIEKLMLFFKIGVTLDA